MDTGLNFKITEDLTQKAPQMASALNSISEAGKGVNDSLSGSDYENSRKKIMADLEKEAAIRRNIREEEKNRANWQNRGTAALGGVTQGIQGATGVVSSLGGGNVSGAWSGVGGMLGEMAKGVGQNFLGAAFENITSLIRGVGALTQPYMQMTDTIIELTAKLDGLSGTTDDMSKAFTKTMYDVTNAGAKYGYSFEQTAAIQSQLLSLGGNTSGATGAMQFAKGFGMNVGGLTQVQGFAGRFGQNNVLGNLGYGAQAGGYGTGRMDQFFQQALSIFEEGLSKGVIKGFDQISATQAWLGKEGGELFRGQTGLQLYKQMNNAIEQGTNLSSEGDVMKYRAARSISKNSADYVTVMKEMEAGLTPDMFKAIKQQVEQANPGNRNAQIETMRALFGTNYTIGEKLLDLNAPSKEELDNLVKGQVAVPDPTNTPEMQVMSEQLKIMTEIAGFGKSALPILQGMSGLTREMLTNISALLGSSPSAQGVNSWSTKNNIPMSGLQDILMKAGSSGNTEMINDATKIMTGISRHPELKGLMTEKSSQYDIMKGTHPTDSLQDNLATVFKNFNAAIDRFTNSKLDYTVQYNKKTGGGDL